MLLTREFNVGFNRNYNHRKWDGMSDN